jgi:hypothetical protein
MASLCSADVDVVVNLEGADIVIPDAVQKVQGFLDIFTMDNSDLFVAMCLPGTFSPNNEGICHDCIKCLANQYETLECIPTRDRTCANCTFCGTHDIELCQCAVKTDQCVTGDRVCVKVPPTVVNLIVDFTSNGVLTTKQQIFIRSGLAVGYTDWLASQFDVPSESVELTDFVKTGATTYKAYFRFAEVYGEAKIIRIQTQSEEFFQGGIFYTFGGGSRRRLLEFRSGTASRRLLQSGVGTNYLTANGVSTSCEVDTNCTEPFTEFKFANGSTCTGSCMPVPCPPGYSGGPKNCQLCPPGTFKNDSGYHPCNPCPAGFTSPIGSNSSEACSLVPTTASEEATQVSMTTASPLQSSSAMTTTSTSTSSAASSSLTPPASQLATASPTPSSSPGQPASLAASSSTPAATSPASSPPPAAAYTSTGQTQPSQTTPSAPTGQTSSATGGTGSSSSGGGGSSINTNTNNNNINVNVNMPPAPPPAPAPPVYVTITNQLPPAPSPVFNNYINIVQPPQQTMPDKDDGYYYHRHWYYYRDDDMLSDWGLIMLVFFFFVFVLTASLCIYYPGCGTCGNCWYDDDRGSYRRHVVRYEIPRQRGRNEYRRVDTSEENAENA